MTPNRNDHPLEVEAHADAYFGGTALIVLGGTSAKEWEKVRDAVHPDVILGANGVNSMIRNLDYWMCIENLKRTFSLLRPDKRDKVESNALNYAKGVADMLQVTGARTRIVSWKSYEYLKDKNNVIQAQRCGAFDADAFPADFSFRKYGNGFIKGALMKTSEALGKDLKLAVGTVGLQLLHFAGILGVSSIHTVGFDLCFKGNSHHAYAYPNFQPNIYFTEKNFVEYKGFKTMQFFVESAEFLKKIEPRMRQEGIVWTDHSNGLLQA